MGSSSKSRPPGTPNYYSWKVWTLLRRDLFAREPLCRMCKAEGRVTAATVADHIEPHRWDYAKFTDPANLQPLCKPHHNRDKQQIEKGFRPNVQIGDDGFPLGPVLPRRVKKDH